MKFGEVPVAEAVGAVLAHPLKVGAHSLRKGRMLSAEDVAALAAAGRHSVIVARLEPGDVDENTAAATVALSLAGAHVSIAPPVPGPGNLFAGWSGPWTVDHGRGDRPNMGGETHTVGP